MQSKSESSLICLLFHSPPLRNHKGVMLILPSIDIVYSLESEEFLNYDYKDYYSLEHSTHYKRD